VSRQNLEVSLTAPAPDSFCNFYFYLRCPPLTFMPLRVIFSPPFLRLKLKGILPIDEAWRRITSQRSLLEISGLKAYSTFIGKAPLGWPLFACGMAV
jgi:hypothetical protein